MGSHRSRGSSQSIFHPAHICALGLPWPQCRTLHLALWFMWFTPGLILSLSRQTFKNKILHLCFALHFSGTRWMPSSSAPSLLQQGVDPKDGIPYEKKFCKGKSLQSVWKTMYLLCWFPKYNNVFTVIANIGERLWALQLHEKGKMAKDWVSFLSWGWAKMECEKQRLLVILCWEPAELRSPCLTLKSASWGWTIAWQDFKTFLVERQPTTAK